MTDRDVRQRDAQRDVPARDARRGERQAVRTLAPVLNTMTQRLMGMTRDISRGGMRVETAAPLVDEALYQVQVELQAAGNRPVRVEAGVQVVRQAPSGEGGTLVGMRFIHMEAAQRDRLSAWLDSPL